MTAKATLSQLLEMYRNSAISHGVATRDGNYKEGNRNYRVIARVYRELRKRGCEAQMALAPLMKHPDVSVRIWSASHCLELLPEQAEDTLRSAAAGEDIVAYTAEVTLSQWKLGKLKFP